MTQSRPKITLYGRPGCPMLPAVEATLQAAEANIEYIDIWQDEQARERVRQINHGHESVPTLVFPDGSTLTEPRSAELVRKLNEIGYQLDATQAFKARTLAQLRNPFFYIRLVAFGFVVYAVLGLLGIV